MKIFNGLLKVWCLWSIALSSFAQPVSYALHFEEGNGVEWNDGASMFNLPVKDISFETKIKVNEVPTTTAFIGRLEEVRELGAPDQLRLDRLEIRMDYVAGSNGYRLVFKYYMDRNFGPPSLINLTKFTQDIPLPTIAYADGVKVEFTGNIMDATLKLNGVPYALTASSVNIPLLLLTSDKTHALGDFGSETALDAELCYFHYEIQNQFGGSGISQQFYFNEGPGNVPVSASGTVLPGSPSDFDWVESDLCQDPLADTDGDGLLDVNELNEDTDGDGLVNYLDNDDDGDGVPTSEEDPNGPQDTDGDGIADYLDTDDDNDGYYTIEEDPNGNNNPMDDDSDGDGVADYLDNLHHQDQVSVEVADYSNRVGDKRYEQSNHLGNVLTVVTDRAIVQPPTTKFPSNELIADVASYSDYYPFGMQMPGKNASTEGYRYGYQGSEKDSEVKGRSNSHTTYYRQLDVRLGKWLSRDPKASATESPYASMGNNPIYNNDPLGDTIRYVGSAKFVKQNKKYIGMLRNSGSRKVQAVIKYLMKSKHDIVITEKGYGEGLTYYVTPISLVEHGQKYVDVHTNAPEVDYDSPDLEAELDRVNDAKLRQLKKLDQETPVKHLTPGVGDGAYVYMPYNNPPRLRTGEEALSWAPEYNLQGNRVVDNAHTRLMHELIHAYRIAAGLMHSTTHKEKGIQVAHREKEEIEAVQFINSVYRSKKTRRDTYGSLGIDSFEIPLEDKFKEDRL